MPPQAGTRTAVSECYCSDKNESPSLESECLVAVRSDHDRGRGVRMSREESALAPTGPIGRAARRRSVRGKKATLGRWKGFVRARRRGNRRRPIGQAGSYMHAGEVVRGEVERDRSAVELVGKRLVVHGHTHGAGVSVCGVLGRQDKARNVSLDSVSRRAQSSRQGPGQDRKNPRDAEIGGRSCLSRRQRASSEKTTSVFSECDPGLAARRRASKCGNLARTSLATSLAREMR